MSNRNLNFRQRVSKELLRYYHLCRHIVPVFFAIDLSPNSTSIQPMSQQKPHWLEWILCCFVTSGTYTRSFCEFLGKSQSNFLTSKLYIKFLAARTYPVANENTAKTDYLIFKVRWLNLLVRWTKADT